MGPALQAGARLAPAPHPPPPAAQRGPTRGHWEAAQPQSSPAAGGRHGQQTQSPSAIPVGPGVGSARPLLSRLAQAPQQGWPPGAPPQQAPSAGACGEPGSSSRAQQAAGQLQDVLRGLLAQASQHAQQAQPAAAPAASLGPPPGAGFALAQQPGPRPAQGPDLSFLQPLVSNGRVSAEALGQVLANLLASAKGGGAALQVQQLASMLAQAQQKPKQEAGAPSAQQALPPAQHPAAQAQQHMAPAAAATAAGAQRYLSLAAQRLLLDGQAALSPGAAAVASGHTQPITTGAVGMPALQPGGARAGAAAAAVPRLPAQQQPRQQQQQPQPAPLPPAPAAPPAVALPPVLKAQLAQLPAEMQPELELVRRGGRRRGGRCTAGQARAQRWAGPPGGPAGRRLLGWPCSPPGPPHPWHLIQTMSCWPNGRPSPPLLVL